MAKRDSKTAGTTFLQGILDKIPADKRAAIQAELLNDDIATYAGEHALRQDEFSRLADETRTFKASVDADRAAIQETYQRQLAWHEQKKADLAELDDYRAGTRANGEPQKVDLSGHVKREDFEKALQQTEEVGLKLMTTMTKLGVKHLADFKEALDIDAVIAHARDKNLRLDLAYDDFIRPRVEERQKQDIDKRIADAKAEGAQEAERRLRATPYPVGSGETTTLDGLNATDPKEFGTQAAIDEFYRMQTAQRAT